MSESESNEEDDMEGVDEGVSHKPFKGSKPSSEFGGSEDEGSNSSNSSDFIVEDDNVVELPVQFSMESHQDLSHQFKKIFQFFVHVAVQTPKRRESFMKSRLAGGQSSVVELIFNNCITSAR